MPPPPPEPCAPARITSDVAPLPEAWRRALDALVSISLRAGLPWSCSNARVALSPPGPDARARLTVAMDGWPVMERDVESPDDLVPAGEALLARPLSHRAVIDGGSPGAPGSAPRPAATPADPAPSGDHAAATAQAIAVRPPPLPYREPRLLLAALVYSRYSGGISAFWMGAEMRATLPIGAWSVGIWARYELAIAELETVPYDFSVSSGSIGVAAGRRLVTAPIEVTALLEPSLAIVSMDGGLDGTSDDRWGAKGDFRIGGRLQGALPFNPRWRGLIALDGELSPLTLASATHRMIAPTLPQIPSFTVAISLGGELAIR